MIRAYGQPFVLLASMAYAAALAERNIRGAADLFVERGQDPDVGAPARWGSRGQRSGRSGADVASPLFLLDRTCRMQLKIAAEDGKRARPLLVVLSWAGC